MTTQLRDTQFGRLVRLLSSNKLLHYPDEIDSSIWESVLRQDVGKPSPLSSEKVSHLDPGRTNSSNYSCNHDSCLQDLKLHEQNQSRPQQRHKDISLVDWYSPGDQEVFNPPIHGSVRSLTQCPESSELA